MDSSGGECTATVSKHRGNQLLKAALRSLDIISPQEHLRRDKKVHSDTRLFRGSARLVDCDWSLVPLGVPVSIILEDAPATGHDFLRLM